MLAFRGTRVLGTLLVLEHRQSPAVETLPLLVLRVVLFTQPIFQVRRIAPNLGAGLASLPSHAMYPSMRLTNSTRARGNPVYHELCQPGGSAFATPRIRIRGVRSRSIALGARAPESQSAVDRDSGVGSKPNGQLVKSMSRPMHGQPSDSASQLGKLKGPQRIISGGLRGRQVFDSVRDTIVIGVPEDRDVFR